MNTVLINWYMIGWNRRMKREQYSPQNQRELKQSKANNKIERENKESHYCYEHSRYG
jgi:hypothetical protein